MYLCSPQVVFITRNSGHEDEVNDFVIVPYPGTDEKRIISCSDDNTLRVWENGKCLKIINHVTLLYSIIFIPETEHLLTTDNEGEIGEWSLFPDIKLLKSFRVCESGSGLSRLTRLTHDSLSPRYFCCSCFNGIKEGHVYLVMKHKQRIDVKELIYPILSTGIEGIRCICQLKTKNDVLFFCGGENIDGKDFRMLFFDWKNAKFLKFIQPRHKHAIRCALTVVNKKGEELIYSGGDDRVLIITNLEGNYLREIYVFNRVSYLLYSELWKFLLIAGYERYYRDRNNRIGYLHYVDLSSKSEDAIPLCRVHRDRAFRMKFFDERKMEFASCSGDSTVLVQKIRSSKYYLPVKSFKREAVLEIENKSNKGRGVVAINIFHDNKMLMTCCYQNINIFDLKEKKIVCRYDLEKYVIGFFFWEFRVLCNSSRNGLIVLKVNFGLGESVSITEEFIIRIGENYSSFYPICNINSNKFATGCFNGGDGVALNNLGELREVTIGENSGGGVKRLCKMSEGIFSICKSKKYPLLYFGGGSENDFTIKKYNFKSSRKEDLELLKNEMNIHSIRSLITFVVDSKEILVAGNLFCDIFILQEELLIWKIHTLNEHPCSIKKFLQKDFLMYSTNLGNIFLVDLKNSKIRCLTNSKNRYSGSFVTLAISEDSNFVYAGCIDEKNTRSDEMKDFDSIFCYSYVLNLDVQLFKEDLNERIMFLRYSRDLWSDDSLLTRIKFNSGKFLEFNGFFLLLEVLAIN